MQNPNEFQPVAPAIGAGQEMTSIVTMAAAARAASGGIEKKSRSEIIKQCEEIGREFAKVSPKSARYTFPVGEGSKSREIVGIAAPLAKAIAMEIGGAFVGATKVGEEPAARGERYGRVILMATVIDLRNWNFMSIPFEQPLETQGNAKMIKKDPGRARQMAFQTGVSKAIRNAISSVYKLECDMALEAALNQIELEKSGKPDDAVAAIEEIETEFKRVVRVAGSVAQAFRYVGIGTKMKTKAQVRDVFNKTTWGQVRKWRDAADAVMSGDVDPVELFGETTDDDRAFEKIVRGEKNGNGDDKSTGGGASAKQSSGEKTEGKENAAAAAAGAVKCSKGESGGDGEEGESGGDAGGASGGAGEEGGAGADRGGQTGDPETPGGGPDDGGDDFPFGGPGDGIQGRENVSVDDLFPGSGDGGEGRSGAGDDGGGGDGKDSGGDPESVRVVKVRADAPAEAVWMADNVVKCPHCLQLTGTDKIEFKQMDFADDGVFLSPCPRCKEPMTVAPFGATVERLKKRGRPSKKK